ncbi:DUF4942 domain-containing protein [Pantoea sp. PNA 03-3]|uniref:DUF4942 domain-containing protein n=1 Tax=Pantoea TaxID=53335 RepID=UPI000D75A008|nr:DUF4942 domain-containing protein [Pantoea sp. PNA 03-3]PXV70881.1 uncharacterized protein DUF4942 [Pantoea sp. PNA 03-3]
MSEKNNVPSVDIFSRQQGTDAIPSTAIEHIISLRNEGIRVYMAGIEQLCRARDLMQMAGKDSYLFDFEKSVESALRWSDKGTSQAETAIGRVIDGKIWDRLMSETGMYTLMSNKQRSEWDKQVAGKDMPEITLDNVLNTFRQLNASKGDTFTQGLIDIFKSLSWDYKTNNPCMFGKRVIISPLLDVHRGGWITFSSDGHTKIDDLARPFYVLEGRNVPDYRVSDGARLDEFFKANQFNGEVFECDYFTVRYFKKGSGHITFTRPDLVDEINNLVARHYPGMLPPRV